MPNPVELARQAESLDEVQWLDFLDELDEVSRRRRQRPPEPDPPSADREVVAAWVVRQHFAADSAIREVCYLPEGAPADEIRLIEVNDRHAGPELVNGSIEAIDFGLQLQNRAFRLLVADVTSEQLEQIRAGTLTLPDGWNLARSQTWRRRG